MFGIQTKLALNAANASLLEVLVRLDCCLHLLHPYIDAPVHSILERVAGCALGKSGAVSKQARYRRMSTVCVYSCVYARARMGRGILTRANVTACPMLLRWELMSASVMCELASTRMSRLMAPSLPVNCIMLFVSASMA